MIAALFATAIALHVSPNHLANGGIDVPIYESCLAVDPNDPKHLVGVASAGEALETATCATFLSRDGGVTWSRAPANFGPYHDHDTLFADLRDPARPHLFALSMLSNRVDGHRRVDVFLARSDDWVAFPRITRFMPSNLNFNTFTGAVLRDGTVVVSYGDGGAAVRRRRCPKSVAVLCRVRLVRAAGARQRRRAVQRHAEERGSDQALRIRRRLLRPGRRSRWRLPFDLERQPERRLSALERLHNSGED
jgi:hypothetical protein